MRELPALFRTEMVQAILEGRKSKTRRVIKPQPEQSRIHPSYIRWWIRGKGTLPQMIPPELIQYAPWQKGDYLWVRETWRIGAWDEINARIAVDYKADGYCRKEWLTVPDKDMEGFDRLWQQSTDDAEKEFGPQERYKWKPGESPCRWRSSMFMYKWITRLWLEVLDVKVEQLQDISGQDAVAEGFGQGLHEADLIHFGGYKKAKEEFVAYWDTIYKKKPEFQWQANPWVWVYEFKRLDQSQP